MEEELELVLRPKVPKPLSLNKGSADPILKPKPSLPLKPPHTETLFKENPSLLPLGTTGSSRTSSGSRKDGAMARPGSEAELRGELGLESHQPRSCAGPGAHSPLQLPQTPARQECCVLDACGFFQEEEGCWGI